MWPTGISLATCVKGSPYASQLSRCSEFFTETSNGQIPLNQDFVEYFSKSPISRLLWFTTRTSRVLTCNRNSFATHSGTLHTFWVGIFPENPLCPTNVLPTNSVPGTRKQETYLGSNLVSALTGLNMDDFPHFYSRIYFTKLQIFKRRTLLLWTHNFAVRDSLTNWRLRGIRVGQRFFSDSMERSDWLTTGWPEGKQHRRPRQHCSQHTKLEKKNKNAKKQLIVDEGMCGGMMSGVCGSWLTGNKMWDENMVKILHCQNGVWWNPKEFRVEIHLVFFQLEIYQWL